MSPCNTASAQLLLLHSLPLTSPLPHSLSNSLPHPNPSLSLPQVRIAKAGLLTLLGVNSFFSAMLQTSPPGTPEEEILVLSSKVLQNVALHPLNRTRLYQAELAGAVRKVSAGVTGMRHATTKLVMFSPPSGPCSPSAAATLDAR